MKVYWDTSALLEAAFNAKSPEGATRTHTLAEMFSNLTGRGVRLSGEADAIRLGAEDAANFIRDACANLSFVDLTTDETLAALAQCKDHGIRGGAIHDWLHAKAAIKAKAKSIVTLNTDNFVALNTGLKLVESAE